jgi:hypothetical protein
MKKAADETSGVKYLWLTLLLAAPTAYAGGGLFGIDHELPLDQNGIWARNYQVGIEYGVIAVEIAGSLKAMIPMPGSKATAIKAFRAARSPCKQAS